MNLLVLDSIIQFSADEKAIRFEFPIVVPQFQTEFSIKPFHITENESDWHGKEPVGELIFI